MCDHDDDCFTVAKRYADDGVIVGNLKRSRGSYVARNTAVSISSGEYITFCDADDTIPASRIRRLFSIMRRHGNMTLANSFPSDDGPK